MATGKLPKALEERPVLRSYSEQYLEAFVMLGYFRNDSGRLEFSDVVAYAKEIGESNVLRFVSVIMEIDRAFRVAQEERKDTDVGKKPGQKNG